MAVKKLNNRIGQKLFAYLVVYPMSEWIVKTGIDVILKYQTFHFDCGKSQDYFDCRGIPKQVVVI